MLDHVQGSAFGVTKMEVGEAPDTARIAAGFGAFLDRERPTVCHFESLDLFGTDVVHEARVRGIATVYCARDTWPAHDRTTLTLPDLSPFELGDADAEARVLVAEALMGPLPADGSISEVPAERDRLEALLHRDLTAPEEVAAMRDARETIEVRRAEKRVALSAVDRRFAASRLLARQLSATVGRAFTFRAPGVDAYLLPDAPALQSAKQKPSSKQGQKPGKNKGKNKGGGEPTTSTIRFGFLGSTRPTEGVQVLIDAFATIRAKMDAPALELVLSLERTDDARDAALEERAERLGAKVQFHGGSVDAKALLSRVDVVVFPSLWGEFEPTAIRIALASGRPVVASDMPGVAEAAPEAACALVAPADADALQKAIVDLATGGETYTRIREGALEMRVECDPAEVPADAGDSPDPDAATDLPPLSDGSVKTVDAEAAEWLDTYRQLIGAARARTRTDRLAHVEDVAAQLERLHELSVPELFERAQEGIGRLRRAFGISDSDASLMARVVARGGVARDRTEQSAAAEMELIRTLRDLHAAREAMRVEESARVRRVGELHAVLGQYEQEALARGAEASRITQDLATSRDEREADAAAGRERQVELEGERDDLAADLAKERDRAAEAETEIRAAQERFEGMAEEAESARTALDEAESERDRLARSVQEREDGIRALRDRVLDNTDEDEPSTAVLESIEAHCVALERDVETLRRHDAWLGEQTARLVALLEPVGRPARDDDPTSDDILERSSRALEQLALELEWRRGEMAAARKASESLRARLAGGPLTSRVKSWSAGPPVVEEPEAAAGGPDDGAPDEAVGDANEVEPDIEEPKAALPARADGAAEPESVTETASGDTSSKATATTEETEESNR